MSKWILAAVFALLGVTCAALLVFGQSGGVEGYVVAVAIVLGVAVGGAVVGSVAGLGEWWAERARRRGSLADRRIREGRCPFCDYNLTGNVSGTCPECGKRVERS